MIVQRSRKKGGELFINRRVKITSYNFLLPQIMDHFIITLLKSLLSKSWFFVIDSQTVLKNILDVAEFLQGVLADGVFRHRAPILVVCNKQGLELCKSAKVRKTCLEAEISIVKNNIGSESDKQITYIATTAPRVNKKGINPLRIVLDFKNNIVTAHHSIVTTTPT